MLNPVEGSGPVFTRMVGTLEISGAITVGIGPAGIGTWMSAPASLDFSKGFPGEIGSGELDKVITLLFTEANRVVLAISIEIGPHFSTT